MMESYEYFHELLRLLCRLGVYEAWQAEGMQVTGLKIKGTVYGEIDETTWY